MKLYKIDFGFTRGRDELSGVRWAGTQADAKAQYKALMDGTAYDVEITPVEVPTDKPGLLAWLNEHMALDAELYK